MERSIFHPTDIRPDLLLPSTDGDGDVESLLYKFRLLREFYGSQGYNFAIDHAKGRLSPSIATQDSDSVAKINQAFFENCSRIFGKKFTSSDYILALKKGVHVIHGLISVLGLPPDQFDLFNEAQIYSESPFRDLFYMTQRSINPQLRYQILMRNILAIISYQNHLRNESLRTENLRCLFYEKLMADLRIDILSVPYLNLEIYSTHDYDNKVIRISPRAVDSLTGTEVRMKKTLLTVRNFYIGGKRYRGVVEMRRKGDIQSVLKALEKACIDGGPIKLNTSVFDLVGFRFVIVDGNIPYLINYLDNFSPNFTIPGLSVVGYEKDDELGDTRGQNPYLNFRRRNIVFKYNNLEDENQEQPQIELVIMSLRNYLNHLYHTGRNGEGIAHDLYEVRRYERAANLLFPRSIYPPIDPYISAQLTHLTSHLRDLNNVVV